MEHSDVTAASSFKERLDRLLRGKFPAAVHVATEPGYPPGGQGMTRIDSPRLSICLEGEGRYLVRRGAGVETTIVRTGEVIYACPGCVMETPLDARYLSLGLVFSTELTRFLLGQKIPATATSTGHRFLAVFHTARTLGDEGRYLHALLGGGHRPPSERGLLRTMEILILRARELLLDPAGAVPPGNKARLRWQAACRFIDDHLQDSLGREDVAKFLRLHPNHVSRLFVRQGGESFKARILRLRLLRARELLRDPALNITEVAQACGFTDANYFTRCFHKTLGRPPGQDRGR